MEWDQCPTRKLYVMHTISCMHDKSTAMFSFRTGIQLYINNKANWYISRTDIARKTLILCLPHVLLKPRHCRNCMTLAMDVLNKHAHFFCSLSNQVSWFCVDTYQADFSVCWHMWISELFFYSLRSIILAVVLVRTITTKRIIERRELILCFLYNSHAVRSQLKENFNKYAHSRIQSHILWIK
jgi:hypothetical protein